MTRPEVLQSALFAYLMILPNAARMARLFDSIAHSEVLFNGWDLVTFAIADSAVANLPAAGDILLGTLENTAPLGGSGINQQCYYLTPSD